MFRGWAVRCHGSVENLLRDQVPSEDERDEVVIAPKDLTEPGVTCGTLTNDRPYFFLRSPQSRPRCLTLAVSREPRLLALAFSRRMRRGSSAGAPCSAARPFRGRLSSC